MKKSLIVLLLAFCLAGGQQPTRVLRVDGDIAQPRSFSAADLAKMPRATVRTNNHGVEAAYESVWLHDILGRTGVPAGPDLQGKELTRYVLIEATDGYQVLFSLAELDPEFGANQVLLADQADGKPLSGMEGPFRLVVPREPRGARSARMVSRITIVQVRK